MQFRVAAILRGYVDGVGYQRPSAKSLYVFRGIPLLPPRAGMMNSAFIGRRECLCCKNDFGGHGVEATKRSTASAMIFRVSAFEYGFSRRAAMSRMCEIKPFVSHRRFRPSFLRSG